MKCLDSVIKSLKKNNGSIKVTKASKGKRVALPRKQ